MIGAHRSWRRLRTEYIEGSVQLDIKPDAAPRMIGDRIQIELVMNLRLNTITPWPACPSRGAHRRLVPGRLRRRSPSRSAIVVTALPPVPAALFDSFFTTSPGRGLGLSIARTIVRPRGRIFMPNNRPAAARVRIQLPSPSRYNTRGDASMIRHR